MSTQPESPDFNHEAKFSLSKVLYFIFFILKFSIFCFVSIFISFIIIFIILLCTDFFYK